MNSIVVATICAMFITFSAANPARNPLLDNIKDACMLMGKANYSVSGSGLGENSPQLGGCVHQNKFRGNLADTFTLWIDDLKHGKRLCGQRGMEKIIFSCADNAKSLLKNTEDETKYIHLYGHIPHKKRQPSIRCALFEKNEINSKVFRIAVSADNSCSSLSKVFSPTFPKISRGTLLLQLTRGAEYQEDQSRLRRSTSNSTSDFYDENWSYVWLLG